MVKTTHAQRLAIKRLVERNNAQNIEQTYPPQNRVTYRELRKRIVPYFDKSGCIMVPLWGMWLGIETDGYTHS